MAQEPVWLTVVEAARRLGVTPQAVRARIKRGSLESRPDNKGNLLVLVSESADNPPATREEAVATLREQVARLEERRAADEEIKAALRERVEELKGERDAERRRAEQAEIRHAELDAQLEAILRQLNKLEERRRPWPGLKVWWRRFWEGEG
jgi:septal ring factor EnvC (AmiA/AmiB activator)